MIKTQATNEKSHKLNTLMFSEIKDYTKYNFGYVLRDLYYVNDEVRNTLKQIAYADILSIYD